MAAAYRDSYKGIGDEVEADPTDDEFAFSGRLSVSMLTSQPATAYIVQTDDDESSTFLDIGNSSVVITGPFRKADVSSVLNLVEAR